MLRSYDELKPEAQRLWDEGKTTTEIARILRVNTSWLSRNVDTTVKPWKEMKYSAMREYKAQGHTMQEVAERFGLSKGSAQRICKGIAPQQAINHNPPKNKGILKADEDVARFIGERMPEAEYAGNYTGADGRVDLRCKKCGAVFNRSMISVRKGHCSCPECAKRKADEAKTIREKAKRLKDEEAERKRKEREAKAQEREAERKRKSEAWKNRPYHKCLVCGTLTQNPKYCCKDCLNKAKQTTHAHRRRARLKAQMVDKDITIEGLFRRDKGVCSLCGGRCDLEDYTVREGVFIAGDWYPSIDHIKPISKGGLHSWGNVQLAHRRCNTLKSDSEL